MNWTRFLLAAAGGLVALVAAGFIWHVLLLMDFYVEQTAKLRRAGEFELWWVILPDGLRALLLSYLYPIGYKGGNPAVEGLRFGVMMGLIVGFPLIASYFAYNFASPAFFWAEFSFYAIQGGLAGIVIAYIWGKAAGQKS